jgi:ABC-2 type transport system ATP-binding protein
VVELAMFVEVLVMVGAPLALARALHRRYPLRWRSMLVGCAGFVLSQVGHIPFNGLVQPLLPDPRTGTGLAVLSVFLGLSAGLFEELARYVAMRWAMRGERTGPHALAYGIGHGGIESAIFGGLLALTLLNLVVMQRTGLTNLGLDDAQLAEARTQIDAIHAGGVVAPLLGAMERLCTIPFHIAASTLVMRAVVEGRVRWLVIAIAFHATTDGLLLPIANAFGPLTTELFVLATLPVSLLTIAMSLRALPKLPRPPREPRPAASGAPIEVVRAEKQYGDTPSEVVHALRGVSFTLKEGERACLLGPNGAGKTTTIRMINGAIAPTRGFVFVFGDTADDETFLEKKRRAGIVPQQPGMYEHLTVRDYLALVREIYAPADPDLGVAERLGLGEMLDRATTALSGGMQRRLALAAALLPRPDLLVLDEPSAGLDPVASRQMIECVKEATVGKTTLLCTHNLAEAEELCDSVVILRAGKVVVHATIEELRSRVAARVALRAHGDRSGLEEALAKLGHATERVEGAHDEVRAVLPDAENAVPGLLRALLAEGVDVIECRIVRPTLEDLFFQVVEDEGGTPSLPAAALATDAEKGAAP